MPKACHDLIRQPRFTGSKELIRFEWLDLCREVVQRNLTDDDDKLLRVFTLDTEFTPSADAWEKLRSAGKPITATIVSAEFESNRVLQDGGPWQSAPLTFTITAR